MFEYQCNQIGQRYQHNEHLARMILFGLALASFAFQTYCCAAQEPDAAMEIKGRSVTEWVAELNTAAGIGEPSPGLGVLASAGPRVLANLDDLLLHSPSATMQAKAAYAIGVIAHQNPGAPELPGAVPALAFAAESEDNNIRLFGIQGLAAIGRAASNGVPLLVRATKDEGSGVRMCAADALGRIGLATPQTVDALKQSMSDESGDVRLTSVRAFYAIGQPVSNTIPVLVQLTKDKSVGVRCGAVETLGHVGTNSPEAIAALKSALHDPSEEFVQPLARKALKAAEAGHR